MSIHFSTDDSMTSSKTYQSLTETELKFALEQEIKVLRIRELNLDDGTSSSYMFVDRDDALDYIFDINMKKNIPVPIGFDRYPYMVEMTLVSSSEMKGSSDIITKIAEMLFDNWFDTTKLYQKTLNFSEKNNRFPQLC